MPEFTDGSALRQQIEEIVARGRRRAQQRTTEKPPNGSPDGEAWRIESALRQGRVPDAYRAASWDRVRSKAVAEWARDVRARCLRRSDGEKPDWSLLGHGLLLLGGAGTGKSSAAGLCCRAAATAGRQVRWAYTPDLLDAMGAGARERHDLVKSLTGVDLLVLDDIGVRDMADWEVGFLDQIVEARYQRFKPMVVTSNWTTREIRDDARMVRLVDRWRERTASQVVTLSGESMRREG